MNIIKKLVEKQTLNTLLNAYFTKERSLKKVNGENVVFSYKVEKTPLHKLNFKRNKQDFLVFSSF